MQFSPFSGVVPFYFLHLSVRNLSSSYSPRSLKNSTCKAQWKEPACQNRRHRRCGLDSWVEDPLEEGMATHYNILAWRIPWTEEPGGLQSMGLQRVRHNWSNLACTTLGNYVSVCVCVCVCVYGIPGILQVLNKWYLLYWTCGYRLPRILYSFHI